MAEVHSSVLIQAPIESVWALATDPRRLGDWVTIHAAVRDYPQRAPSEGDTMEQTLQLHGAAITVRWRLVECDRPHLARWLGSGPGGSSAEISYLLSAVGPATRFEYHNAFTPPFGTLGAMAARTLTGVSLREAERSLQRLKALLEREQRLSASR